MNDGPRTGDYREIRRGRRVTLHTFDGEQWGVHADGDYGHRLRYYPDAIVRQWSKVPLVPQGSRFEEMAGL